MVRENRPSSKSVLLDLTGIPDNYGGVGRYLESLVEALLRVGFDAFVVVCKQTHVERLRERLSDISVVAAPRFVNRVPLRLLWEQLGLPSMARRLGVGAIHSPHYTLPIFTRLKRAVTLHDATFFSHPEMHVRHKVYFFRTWSRLAWRMADVVFVPSTASARLLRDALGTREKPIFVAKHGVDERTFHPATEAEKSAFRETWSLQDRRVVSFLGTIEPRKNVPELMAAFKMLVAEAEGTADLTLVLSGDMGWDNQVLALRDKLGISDRLILTGYLDRESLRSLLSTSEVVVYPSEAEGFGLPVLEAMACGSCVISSPYTAIPEVGGDAIAYCEPRAREIFIALKELLGNSDQVASLRSAALKRSKLFSWETSAAVHAQGYNVLMNPDSLNPVVDIEPTPLSITQISNGPRLPRLKKR